MFTKFSQDMDTFTQSTKRNIESVNDKIDITRLQTDQKLEGFRRLEDRLDQIVTSVQELENMVLKTKGEIYDALGQQREFFAESCVKVDDKEQKIKHQILDVKYWMEMYTNSHKELDKTLNLVKSELRGDYEKAMFALD